ncbi:Gfo/Idh/MocA family protein [Jiella marina]|uniref:Gfo/Idh/MocA family protein n=1 Tax=Jiella sp. LLJ827 TaxID=2917712 RepID=UPI00210077E8|nr:Gfo/Idh/MocA family oxidoreductase [Jiella sp. LLJ827]MCQ0990502.1 Gfo/Idh/MocA family oxidoreductase [Jiella sp. LLJ827]
MTIEGRDDRHSGRIRLGMVGGGQGAFIGGVHRIASRIDDKFTLVAGALSSTPEKARASAAEIGLDPERSYGSYEEMAEKEKGRPDGIEAVAIVTPNHMHFPVAKTFLEAGFHVICDKPMTTTLGEARQLGEIARAAGKVFVLTHNYTGYPMIRQARSMVANGDLGTIRLVVAEYVQDWLADRAEDTGSKQAGWRVDPAKAGAGGAIGDIGTHAHNLACYVTGLKVEKLAADLSSFVPGRQLDDNASMLLRFAGGAKGSLWASQVAVGNENGLTLRVYGDKGGLEWAQEEPNKLWYTPLGEPKRLLTRGGAGANDAAVAVSRIPAGHPEGYLEGFATIYIEAAALIRAADAGEAPPADVALPTIEDGIDGLAFIEACVKSSKADGAWVTLGN